VIIILFDALSAYHLPLYGYDKIKTPNIDSFANESIVFAPMLAPSNYTAQSIPSILTSKTPYKHRLSDFDEYLLPNLKDENILRILRENGYFCYSIVQNPLASLSAFGLQEWIDKEPYPVFIPNVSYKILSFILIISKFSNKMDIYSYGLLKKWTATTFRARKGSLFDLAFSKEITDNPFLPSIPFEHAVSLIKNEKRPFFLFLHIFPPHDPFLPPNELVPEHLSSVQKQRNYLHRPVNEDEFETIQTLKNLYDKNIEYIDEEFGTFLDQLKRSGIFDNSFIILTSDHGETFVPEWVGHNSISYAYEPMIRVPFIMKMPYSTLHQDINIISSGLDIAPSILDVLNIDIPVWMEGETLVPFINGEKLKRDFPSMCMRIAKRKKKFIDNCFITLVGEIKLIYYIKQKEIRLTDPVNDPYDKKDISEVFPDEKEKLRKYLFEYLGISEIPQKLSYPNN
jgi:arylsulfatase A-like enzyme